MNFFLFNQKLTACKIFLLPTLSIISCRFCALTIVSKSMIKTKNVKRSKGVLVGISGLNAMDHPGSAVFISVYILMIIKLVSISKCLQHS